LGLVILVMLILGYALLADAFAKLGPLLWIPIGAIAIANAAAAVKFRQYRSWLGGGVKAGFEAVAEYFTRDSTRGKSEREAVPRPIQRRVLARANHRCQFPKCEQQGRQRLDIHHVDMNPSNSRDEDNLIAVCPNHHREIHSDPDISMRQVRVWARRRARVTNSQN
jgi:hypothetical protein